MSAFTQGELERMVGGKLALGADGVMRRVATATTETARPVRADRYKSEWEREYAQRLDLMVRASVIAWWAYEGIKVRLADGAWYTPDFLVRSPDGALEVHEVKGEWREAARVRVKVAAEALPWLPIRIIQKEHGVYVTVETFNA